MVVKADGTKWACHTCLIGHRVSRCNHTDQKLFPVPRKGRPVSQCQHCRTERKGRSAHVKCDCGAKPFPEELCINANKARSTDIQSSAFAATTVGDYILSRRSTSPGTISFPNNNLSTNGQHCCCPHGGKCICTVIQKAQSKCNDTNSMKDSSISGLSKPNGPQPTTLQCERRAVVGICGDDTSGPGRPYKINNINHERMLAPPSAETPVYVQDQSQARYSQQVSIIDKSTQDLTLLQQGSPRSLYDFHGYALPLYEEVPSFCNTFPGLTDQTHREYGTPIIPTIPPDTAIFDVSSASSYPTAWSSFSAPTDQWQAVEHTRYVDSDWTQSWIMSAAMSGLYGGEDPLAIEDTSWPYGADVQEDIDPSLLVDFNTGFTGQSMAHVATTEGVELEDKGRMTVDTS